MVSFASNIASLRAQRRANSAADLFASTSERLSSGRRINRASDDAAGLAVSSVLNVRGRVYYQAIRNGNDGISALSLASGATDQLSSILTRLKELASGAANGSLSRVQRLSLDTEAKALTDEYNRIISTTSFNGRSLLSSASNSLTLQLGFGSNELLTGNIGGGLGGATGTGAFGTVALTGVSTIAGSGATGDFNRDGKGDVVYLTSTSQLQVYTGNGSGGFAVGTAPSLGATGTDVAAADMNSDGILDLVASHASNVSVLIGNGNGTFKSAVQYSVGSTTRSVRLGDMTGDGILDVALTTNTGVSLLKGNSDGTLGAVSSVTGPGVMSEGALGDFNGDGKLDLFSGQGTTGYIYSASASGVMQLSSSFSAGSVTAAAASTDFNHDGIGDIVIGTSTGLSVFVGNGNNTFQTARTYALSGGYSDIVIGDYNGDGYPDVAGVQSVPVHLKVSLGNGDGTLGAVSTYNSGGGTAGGTITSGDLNGDGVTDLLALDYDSAAICANLGLSSQLTTVARLDLTTRSGALLALTTLDTIMQRVASEQGAIGASMSRVSSALGTLGATQENYAAASSRITDADIASEAATLLKSQVLQQSAQAVLAQANQEPAIALKLLRI